jgi:uncharacterized protein
MKENKMVVGVLRLELRLAEVHSLKEKRGRVKRVINQIRSTYNASAAEVDKNDIWQEAVIGVTVVGNETNFVNSCLDQILNFVENLGLGELTGQELEIIHI